MLNIIQGCLENVDVFTQQLNVGGAKDWYCEPLVKGTYLRALPGYYSGHFISGGLNVHTWVRLEISICLSNIDYQAWITIKLPLLIISPFIFYTCTKHIKTLQIIISKSSKKMFVTFSSLCAVCKNIACFTEMCTSVYCKSIGTSNSWVCLQLEAILLSLTARNKRKH